ncbi:MAG: proline--tRNA ligase [Candidatus Saccharibacteria bacterium]|nr:proline--tRNA ligase [Candidatus Saccharibacteria bacterium]
MSEIIFYSRFFGRSTKTTSLKSKIKSHQLLVQAGYIRESVAGRYYFLPLGQRLQLKVMNLIRQEMNKAGALEMLSPVLHPLSLWQETNRDQATGFELMQLKDRRNTAFALGGTAEEMFVDVVRKFNLSYKDLPINIYQFGLKFRDELRARGGLLRVREFIMKDAYSFSTQEQFKAVYQQMAEVYTIIFKRLGLTTKMVDADGGYIGGDYCHEFVVDSPVGESVYFFTQDGYLAHEDIAVFNKELPPSSEKLQILEKVSAERGPTMADSFKCHQPVPLNQHIKNVVYLNEKQEIILACLRGDLEVNETKLKKASNCHQLTPLTNQQIKDWLDSEAGFISAVGLKAQSKDHPLVIVADDSILVLKNAISGANQLNFDYININYDRDFKAQIISDIALAKDGYLSLSGQTLIQAQGIEVGNIFQLGYHYSDKMKGAEYTDQKGVLQKYYMGCYGIGIGRTIATMAEVLSDDQGLIWPLDVSPFHIYVIDLIGNQEAQTIIKDLAENQNWEILYDDRQDVSAGQKLNNADLLGLPLRVIISPKTLKSEALEIKCRSNQKVELVKLNKAADYINQYLFSA